MKLKTFAAAHTKSRSVFYLTGEEARLVCVGLNHDRKVSVKLRVVDSKVKIFRNNRCNKFCNKFLQSAIYYSRGNFLMPSQFITSCIQYYYCLKYEKKIFSFNLGSFSVYSVYKSFYKNTDSSFLTEKK